MPRPRIALCMEYPIEQTGGVETLVRELVRGLADEFSIVLVSDDTADSLGKWNDALTSHIRWNRAEASAVQGRRLARALADQRVKLAHFHFGGTYNWLSRYPGSSPVVETHRLGVPCLLTNHLVTGATEGFTNPARPLWFRLIRFPVAWVSRLHVLFCARAEMTVSDADCRRERAIFFPVRNRISRMYHSQLDESEQAPGIERERIILNVGSIGPRKGQIILVNAFAKIAAGHPDWRLRIVGRAIDLEYEAQVHAARDASGCADRIELAGRLSDEETVRAMYQASIFAMPSLAEGLGLSLQEAMFRGCACIGSAVGGIPDMIRHGATGRTVPPGSAAELAAQLSDLISSPAEIARLALEGRKHVLAQGMTRTAMLERHAALYKALAGADP